MKTIIFILLKIGEIIIGLSIIAGLTLIIGLIGYGIKFLLEYNEVMAAVVFIIMLLFIIMMVYYNGLKGWVESNKKLTDKIYKRLKK